MRDFVSQINHLHRSGRINSDFFQRNRRAVQFVGNRIDERINIVVAGFHRCRFLRFFLLAVQQKQLGLGSGARLYTQTKLAAAEHREKDALAAFEESLVIFRPGPEFFPRNRYGLTRIDRFRFLGKFLITD